MQEEKATFEAAAWARKALEALAASQFESSSKEGDQGSIHFEDDARPLLDFSQQYLKARRKEAILGRLPSNGSPGFDILEASVAAVAARISALAQSNSFQADGEEFGSFSGLSATLPNALQRELLRRSPEVSRNEAWASKMERESRSKGFHAQNPDFPALDSRMGMTREERSLFADSMEFAARTAAALSSADHSRAVEIFESIQERVADMVVEAEESSRLAGGAPWQEIKGQAPDFWLRQNETLSLLGSLAVASAAKAGEAAGERLVGAMEGIWSLMDSGSAEASRLKFADLGLACARPKGPAEPLYFAGRAEPAFSDPVPESRAPSNGSVDVDLSQMEAAAESRKMFYEAGREAGRLAHGAGVRLKGFFQSVSIHGIKSELRSLAEKAIVSGNKALDDMESGLKGSASKAKASAGRKIDSLAIAADGLLASGSQKAAEIKDGVAWKVGELRKAGLDAVGAAAFAAADKLPSEASLMGEGVNRKARQAMVATASIIGGLMVGASMAPVVGVGATLIGGLAAGYGFATAMDKGVDAFRGKLAKLPSALERFGERLGAKRSKGSDGEPAYSGGFEP